MASRAIDYFEHIVIDVPVRPALRLVEPMVPATPVATPVVPDATPETVTLPMPPAWMVAPAFRAPAPLNVTEQQKPYSAATVAYQGPYRTARDVPRA